MTGELTAPAGQGYRLSSGEPSVTGTIDQAVTSGALIGASVTDDSGPELIWRTRADLESSDPGRLAPLADALALDTSAADATPAADMAATPVTTVIDRPEGDYYELLVDGEQAGLLVYHVIGTHLTITHTMIERSYRGHGLSQTLLGQALDGIREKGLTVSNYCPVVGRFVESHPEYGDLLARPQH